MIFLKSLGGVKVIKCIFEEQFMGFPRQEYWRGLPFPSPMDHIMSELSTMTCPSWVDLHGIAHSSIELDKAVVQVIRFRSDWLVFYDCGFHSVWSLMEKDKRLMECSEWERLTEGETGSCSDGQGHAQFSSVAQSCPTVCNSWAAAYQASLSITNSQSLFKLMPSNHLILCCPLLLLPSIFPSIGSFPMSQLFSSGGQSIRVSALASVLLINIEDWFPYGWTGWISLQSKGLSRVFYNTTVQKHQFFSTQLSLESNSHIPTWLLEKS